MLAVKYMVFLWNGRLYGLMDCEHVILGQLRMGARQTKNAPLDNGWSDLDEISIPMKG